jgi:predicted dehydrogenase
VEADDNAHICIEFANNCYAVVTTGFTIQKYRTPAVEIYGSAGTIQMLGDDWDPDGYELWQNKDGAWKIFEETHPNWPWTDGINHLVECIIEGKKPIITPEHAYHAIEIMEAARAAGRDGQRREIQSTFTPPSFFTTEEEQEALHLRHDRTNN